MDNYTEQLISVKPRLKQLMPLFVAIMITSFGVMIAVFINFSTGAMLVIIGGIAIHFTKNNMLLEYEYIFTNGDFEVARILAKSTRKNICEINEEDLKRILPYNSDKFQNELDINSKMKVKDYSSGEKNERKDCFAFIKNDNGRDLAIILELNDKNKDYIKSVYKNKIEL
ncbi:MAG: hypothetical protein IJ167_07575 [Lachnospiraceae bacterium]|nr:hypothetical protein [Lachnospiraceae bacterium]